MILLKYSSGQNRIVISHILRKLISWNSLTSLLLFFLFCSIFLTNVNKNYLVYVCMCACCAAIDLCAEGKHDCEQICISAPGVFTCDCNKGFKLNKDKKTCTSQWILSASNAPGSACADFGNRQWKSLLFESDLIMVLTQVSVTIFHSNSHLHTWEQSRNSSYIQPVRIACVSHLVYAFSDLVKNISTQTFTAIQSHYYFHITQTFKHCPSSTFIPGVWCYLLFCFGDEPCFVKQSAKGFKYFRPCKHSQWMCIWTFCR